MEIESLGMKYPIRLFNGTGNQVYYENSDGFWWKQVYDDKQRIIGFENSSGQKETTTYTDKGKTFSVTFSDKTFENWYFDKEDRVTYRYNSVNEYWFYKNYDSEGNVTYYKNSIDGIVIPEVKETMIMVEGREYSETTIRRALEFYLKP